MLVNYTYYKIYANDSYNFNTGYKIAKKYLEKSNVIAAAINTLIEAIFESLKIAEESVFLFNCKIIQAKLHYL